MTNILKTPKDWIRNSCKENLYLIGYF